MKRIITFSFILLMLLGGSVNFVKAQTDLTDRFLVNPGFDLNCTYTKDAEAVDLIVQGNLASTEGSQGGCLEIYGWNLTGIQDWSCSTSFEYGYTGMFNPTGAEGIGAIPSSGYTGSVGCLGISTAWTNTITYTQDAFLPAGSYTIETAAYNSGVSATNNTSRVGWTPSSGDAVYSGKNNFALNEWEVDKFDFDLSASSPGKIQVGITCANAGSGSVGRIFFDYIKITCNNIDKGELSAMLEEGTSLLTDLENMAEMELKENLAAAMNSLEEKINKEAGDPELINEAINFLEPFFTAKYTMELFDILFEAENALSVSGGSTETRQILNATIESTYNAYDNGEIGFADFSTYIENLRIAMDNYLASGAGLKLHYDFNEVNDGVVKDQSGSGFDGTLTNGARVTPMGKYNVMYTDNNNGYLDMGAGVGNVIATMNNFTVSTYYRVDDDGDLSGAGRFLWTFSSRESNSETAGEYMAYRLNAQLYQASGTGYGSDRKITYQIDGEDAGAAAKGKWQHILYRQTGSVGELWLNGELIASLDTMYLRNEIITGPTSYNWLARPAFSGDNYLKRTAIYDFRLYNEAIENGEITEFAALVADLNKEYAESSGGDFTALNAKVEECKTILANAAIGDEINEYPESAKIELEEILGTIEEFLQAGIGSQLVIDSKIRELETALAKFLASKHILNYAAGWDGDGATGDDSSPVNFGWASTPEATNWNVANGSGGMRYMDPGNGEYANYKLNDVDYNVNRILWIRYNNSEEFTYTFAGLEPGKPYKLQFNYGWHNNGSTPNITVGIYTKEDGMLIQESNFTASDTKRELKNGEIPFMAPKDNTTSDSYYVSIKNDANGDCMLIVADLVVTDNPGGSSLPEINAEKPKFTIINCEGGIRISCNDLRLMGNTPIYAITGQIVKSVNITGNQSFVSLARGIYIVGHQKIVVR